MTQLAGTNAMSEESTDSSVGFGSELPDDLLSRLRITIPGYKLLSEIARGGQAVVYKARADSKDSLDNGNLVAIKVLRGGQLADEPARERLRREARVLGALRHRNIVHFIASGQTSDGFDFLVMDYIDGKRLDAFFPEMRHTELVRDDPSIVLKIFLKICDAVSVAHREGITHRDLSPSNIMIAANDEPYIVDFGLARTAFDKLFIPDTKGPTVTGQFLGKWMYASPEQARGMNKQVDIRADIYSLGVILYQLLTGGHFPYQVHGSLVDVLDNILRIEPRPFSEILACSPHPKADGGAPSIAHHAMLVNPAIETIVRKALKKDPDHRYQSAGVMADEIRNYLAGGTTTVDGIAPRDEPPAENLQLNENAQWLTAVLAFLVPVALMVLGLAYAWKTGTWPFHGR